MEVTKKSDMTEHTHTQQTQTHTQTHNVKTNRRSLWMSGTEH